MRDGVRLSIVALALIVPVRLAAEDATVSAARDAYRRHGFLVLGGE